jgi:hypothetical protein
VESSTLATPSQTKWWNRLTYRQLLQQSLANQEKMMSALTDLQAAAAAAISLIQSQAVTIATLQASRGGSVTDAAAEEITTELEAAVAPVPAPASATAPPATGGTTAPAA